MLFYSGSVVGLKGVHDGEQVSCVVCSSENVKIELFGEDEEWRTYIFTWILESIYS